MTTLFNLFKSVLDWIIPIIITFFTPAKYILFILAILVFYDTVIGIKAAKFKKEKLSSNRFNDTSYGNVTSKLTVQGNAAPGASLKGGWTLYNMEKSRKAKVVVSQVHFTDGAVWDNKNFDSDVEREKQVYE